MLYHLIKSAERIGFWFVFFFFLRIHGFALQSVGFFFRLGFSLRLGLLFHLFFRIDVGLLFRNDVGFFFFFFPGLVLLQFIYLFSYFSSQFLAIKNLRVFLIFSEGVPNFFFLRVGK